MGENNSEPLARTRTRRSNAGARMHEMMFAAEDEELFAQIYEGLLKDEDSSEDEEYVPKEVVDEAGDGEELDNEDNGSESGSDMTSDDDDQDDDDDDEEDDEEDKDKNNSDIDMKVQNADRPAPENSSQNQDLKKNLTKKKESSPEKKATITFRPGSPSKGNYDSCSKICSVCLGDQLDENDEVIECDSCGVSVHESCYGVSENENAQDDESVHSNQPSESTEPWFCEPCRRSVQNPFCELCPNTGGIFKETDTGRWVHMVCALYTRGVTFQDIESLSEVSLFELNYSLYGSKACTICEDRRLARSGVCIGCDAGLCKTFFHATCAQKEGLLFESHSDEIDPFFAQCKQHADKTIIRKKKRTCTALFARLKRIRAMQSSLPPTTCSDIKAKLDAITQQPDPHLTKWTTSNRPPIPQRVSRSLMTSPSLIIRLTRKSELMGLDPKSAFMSVQDEIEMARQKWHIPPAFDLEFVAYCQDRTTRMLNMKKNNTELLNQNVTLKEQESGLREKYNSIKEVASKLRATNDSLIREARALQKLVSAATGKKFNLPMQMEQLVARNSNNKSKNCVNSTYGCGKCGTIKDQHLLALCDTCHEYRHIYCLDPPLTRVPKKTKFGGWQCSDC